MCVCRYNQHVSRVQRLSTLCVEYQKTAASIQAEVGARDCLSVKLMSDHLSAAVCRRTPACK